MRIDERIQEKCESMLETALDIAEESAEQELEKIDDDKCRLAFIREYYLPVLGGIAEAAEALLEEADKRNRRDNSAFHERYWWLALAISGAALALNIILIALRLSK